MKLKVKNCQKGNLPTLKLAFEVITKKLHLGDTVIDLRFESNLERMVTPDILHRASGGYLGGFTNMIPNVFQGEPHILIVLNTTTPPSGVDKKAGDWLWAFFHEIGHAWQVHKRRFIAMPGDSLIFNGKYYCPETMPAYDKQPWEAEANAIADNLMTAFRIRQRLGA